MNRSKRNDTAERCRELAKILITPLREVARRNGYALGVHGSLSYDIDLIACPWRESPMPPEALADDIRKAVEAIAGRAEIADGCPTQKPHGRLAWSFLIGPTGVPYVDLSVMPRGPSAEPHQGQGGD